jgi:multiple sugar transport system permease protein
MRPLKMGQVSNQAGALKLALPRKGQFRLSESAYGYLFIAPWLIGFLVFTLGPLVVSFFLMFFDYAGYKKITFVGLENFQELLTYDFRFRTALGVSLTYTVITVTLYLVVGLGLALLVHQKFPGRSLFRTIYFLPAAVSGVAMVYVWLSLFETDYGMLNQALRMMNLRPIPWLTSTEWALRSYVIMAVYGVGNYMIVFLAGLEGIPEQLYEAAKIDGAGSIARFFSVTLPMMSSTIFFLMVISVIQSLQVFMQGFMMTSGGPANSTLFYVLYLYQVSFGERRFGYGSVLAWLLFLIILALTAFQFWLSRRWVYYEAGETA